LAEPVFRIQIGIFLVAALGLNIRSASPDRISIGPRRPFFLLGALTSAYILQQFPPFRCRPPSRSPVFVHRSDRPDLACPAARLKGLLKKSPSSRTLAAQYSTCLDCPSHAPEWFFLRLGAGSAQALLESSAIRCAATGKYFYVFWLCRGHLTCLVDQLMRTREKPARRALVAKSCDHYLIRPESMGPSTSLNIARLVVRAPPFLRRAIAGAAPSSLRY